MNGYIRKREKVLRKRAKRKQKKRPLPSRKCPSFAGACGQPDHCDCDKDWFGVQCDKKCDRGSFLFTEQRCDCDEGWSGNECSSALCERDGCVNGECVEPDVCKCFSGYAAGPVSNGLKPNGLNPRDWF